MTSYPSTPGASHVASAAGVVSAALLLVACGGGGDDNPQSATVAPAVACSSLANKTILNVQVTAAVAVAASGAIPAYCKVAGTESGTQHDIEVRLPDAWQGRYVEEGGGGFDGSIPQVGAKNVALSSGAVQTANNGGHRDPSGSVFLNNPLVVQRYAHTAILTATRFGKAITSAYYGKGPKFSYYEGCSNGGRGALNAADKYGDEYDGVIAGAPTRNLTGQIEQWTRASALTIPSVAKLTAINAAAVTKCDALDGATDGIVSNWQACKFDPTVDVPASVGLTSGEATSVKSLMTDLSLSNGKTIYSGYGIGNMSQWGPIYGFLGVGHMQNIVLNDATWSPATFDVNSYYQTISNVIDGTYGFSASTAGLAQFLNTGKKILIWHGSDDGLLSHKDTLRTWQDITSAAGTAASNNSKVYIASGVNHCGGGPGADTFDMLTPMMNWVEKGTVPGDIPASKVTAGVTQFTRPVCEHPKFPKYSGSGNVNEAANYTCAAS
jgi:feruloyl esterase